MQPVVVVGGVALVLAVALSCNRFNQRVDSVPSNLIARLGGFPRHPRVETP